MEIENRLCETQISNLKLITQNKEKLSLKEQKQLLIDLAIHDYERVYKYDMVKYGIIEQSEEKPPYEEFLERINK